jgi:hypothetical protein
MTSIEANINASTQIYNSLTCSDSTNIIDEESKKIDDNIFKSTIDTFLNDSQKLDFLHYNETSGSYISSIQDTKLSDLNLTNNNLHNDQYNNVRKYQLQDYLNNKVKFYYQIYFYILLLLVIILILASCVNLDFIKFNTFLITASILIFIFIIYLLLNLKNNNYRRGYNWNKYYFTFNKKTSI